MSWLLVASFLVGAATREEGLPVGAGKEKAVVKLTSPRGGWSVGRMLRVTGTVSDSTIDPVTVSINGDRYLLRTIQGRFDRSFPAASGQNVVKVYAENLAGRTVTEATAYAEVPTVPFKVVLTSDTDGVYTDLHIYEPTDATSDDAPKMAQFAHVFWSHTESPSGGTFFLNEQGGSFDQPGYGPYLYVHRAPPNGLYAITANYWPSGDKAHTVGTLNLTLFEGTTSEVRKRVDVPLSTPGTTKVLAFVRMFGERRASVLVPTRDAMPKPVGPSGPSALPGPWPSNLGELRAELESKDAQGGEGL